MLRKNSLFLSLVLLLSLTVISPAATTTLTWDRGGGTSDWNTGQNWSTDIVPPNNSSNYTVINMTAGPVITTGTIGVYRISLTTAGNGTLTVNDGILNVGNHIFVGPAGPDRGTVNMNGGAVNITGTLWVSRDGGSIGTINLLGGTITCATLAVGSNTGTGASINIEGNGKLIYTSLFAGTPPLDTMILNGWIKAYGGAGTVKVDTTTIPGKTIISARAQYAAAKPVPDDGQLNVPTNATLSWKPLAGTTSHDVYLGTNLTDVTNAGRLAADLNGNTIVDWPDVSVLTQSWLLDPAGTDPYAGVNDDNNVDLLDYSLLAQDWMSNANPIFKGNQDANTFDPGTLAEGTIYYWRVDEVNSTGTATGDVWKFTTQGFANVRKGPYLIYPNVNTQMTVLWQADATTTSSNIAWGTDTTYSTGSASTTEYGADHQHKYNITGLTPGTKYYYRVTVSGAPYTGSFTAAPAASATNVKFFMYGDTRTYPASHNLVAGGMNATYAADPNYQTIALHAGDWVAASTEADWTGQWYTIGTNLDIWALGAKLPIMGCIGNHETGSIPIFQKYRPFPFVDPSRTYYSFDYGPLHVTVLDQYTTYTSGSAQYNWLVADLAAASTKPWKIIVLHQPGWACGGGHENDTTVQGTIQPLCLTYDVQIVLAGHVHYYSRAVVPAAPTTPFVEHVTNGAGGASAYVPNAGYPNIVTYSAGLAYTKVDISGDTLTCTTMRPDHVTVLDSFTLTQ